MLNINIIEILIMLQYLITRIRYSCLGKMYNMLQEPRNLPVVDACPLLPYPMNHGWNPKKLKVPRHQILYTRHVDRVILI